jgi:hypothetical protein
MTGWGIHRLADMIGSQNNQAGLPDGRWVRAVPMPYQGARLKAAWAVLRGMAYAVEWPQSGDLEKALAVGAENVRPTSIRLSRAEIQSGLDRVKWAEGLVLQLPEKHDGRNSWLLNYGVGPESEAIRKRHSDRRTA